MLDFRIFTFLCVCRHMNYTKAAAELHITQPAVSQHIRYLEKEYQTKLFEYQGKHLELTQSGMELLNAAVTIRHDDIMLKERIQELKRNTQVVAFGATHTIGEFMIVDKLAEFLQAHNDVTVRLEIADTKQLLSKLDAGEIDFCIVEGFFEQRPYETLLFSQEPLIAVCSQNFEVSEKVQLMDLLQKRLIVREKGSGSRDLMEHCLAEYSLTLEDFPNACEVGSPQAVKSLVCHNAGFSFFYEKAVQKELASGELRKINIEGFETKHAFTFLWRKGSMYSLRFREIFEELKDD
ncbi:MAG: LysR family transcriptional regulator [Caecibacter sp.]|jgi:DNA-binding transcriptional LysR family regulator|nr:LysR family transcriptional regulator [Megasphaera sp.]MEE0722798.1 LysR family transcriptional regulator [Caecibacter sp.]